MLEEKILEDEKAKKEEKKVKKLERNKEQEKVRKKEKKWKEVKRVERGSEKKNTFNFLVTVWGFGNFTNGWILKLLNINNLNYILF